MKTKLRRSPKRASSITRKSNLIADPDPRVGLLALKGTRGQTTSNKREMVEALRLAQERQKLTEQITALQVRLMQSNRVMEGLLQKTGGRPYLMHARHWTTDASGISGTEPSPAPIKRGRGRPRKIRPEEITGFSVPPQVTKRGYRKVKTAKPKAFKTKKVRGLGKLKTGRRGKLKSKILKLLSKKGSMRVKDIAKAINKKQGDVFTWFSITGKTTPGIKKVSKATYSFNPKKLLAAA